MTIALVGFTDSYNDRQWLLMTERWLEEHDPVTADAFTMARREIFDLRGVGSRNFLDDVAVFDVVVLFAIYNPPAESVEFKKAFGRTRGQTSLAKNHSQERWSARLSSSNAKYLFVFRRDESVDGHWLGEINPYVRAPESPGVFGVSIYTRLR